MRLGVFKDVAGDFIKLGTLETLSDSGEQFVYNREYLASSDAYPLSHSLPLQEEAYGASKARPFFEGLLPEGSARAAIARQLGVKSSSYIKILAENGLECIGAIVITADNTQAKELNPSYDPIPFGALDVYAKNGREAAPELQAATRLSLAGAQMKTGLYHESGTDLTEGWYLPKNSAPSTHIVKFANADYPDLIINEYLCLKAARTSGLVVPSTHLLPTSNPTLCIERYDRIFCGEDVPVTSELRVPIRLHQEDLAQALGVLPAKKYDEHLWGGYKGLASFLASYSSDPAEDLASLIRIIIFNYLIGNCDNHLKNYSILYQRDWSSFSLAPMYDLVSTVIFERLERVMAMRIGKHNHIDRITREDFKLLGEQLGVSANLIMSECTRIAHSFSGSLEEHASDLQQRGYPQASLIASSIIESAQPRIELLMQGN